jgi:hypothetical protein
VAKSEGRRPLEKPKRRWRDNIKIGLREVGLGGMDWIDLLMTGKDGGLVWMR